MNNDDLNSIIRDVGQQVEGAPGFWHFIYAGTRLVCITSEAHDRMRIMTPISPVDEFPADAIYQCMEANYDQTLDARYCINRGTLWSAFLHPFEDLTKATFISACQQVAEASRTFGTTFSSSDMRFDSGPG